MSKYMGARWALLGCSAAVLAAGPAWAQSTAPVKEVKVKLMTSTGEPAGTAVLKQKSGGVQLKVSLENLPFGEHGVHIHEHPACDAPDFKSAGGHFNPEGKQHGFQNPEGHHLGDTPSNVSVGEDHRGSATWMLMGASLQPGAPDSLLANGGTSIVVHEHADDMKTNPSGNSGNRIACGVIRQ